ncbi:MAG: hypothetical protein D6702_08625 [Planctomycetota bacterium]|nr:MAG: hypothetical protein D6702_08625 [Planctomycetota bacterium]
MSAFLLCLALCPAQEPAAEPLPAGVVARLDGEEIPLRDYLDFLYLRMGKRPLEEYLAGLLVEREARRYGIELPADQLEEMVAERERTEREAAPPGGFEERLAREGKSVEMYRRLLRQELRREYLTDQLVRATRVVTDQRLRQEFEREYGPGGVRVRVRHVLVMPNVLRAERLRAGVKPDQIDLEELRAAARAQAERALERLRAGEDFAAVAAALSHDRVTRDQGGELRNYNGRLYGPTFKQAIDALQPGEISEVIETGAGFHVVQLLERTVTDLEAVRAELIERILAAEPDWQERNALVQALRGKAEVQLW